jgi:hypothetical protein
MKPPPLPQTRPGSAFVTFFAWAMIVAGLISLPVSFITMLMLVSRSYGTANAGFIDSCVVILGPLFVVGLGFGLWRRWRWGFVGTVGLLGLMMMLHAWKLAEGPPPATPGNTYTTTSSSGVTTTVIGAGPNYHSWPILLLCAGTLAKLLTRNVRNEFSRPASSMLPLDGPSPAAPPTGVTPNDQKNWRVGHRGRDMMYYEEKISGNWQRIDISGEMLMGPAHHVIYFASEEAWQHYPEWARHRRGEIIARIVREFREPDYAYQQADSSAAASLSASSATSPHPGRDVVTGQQRAAFIAFVVILLAITGGMGWLVKSGLERGETFLPSKRASQQRVLLRQLEPSSFWAAIGVYTLIGLGSGSLALWSLRTFSKR